MLTAEHYLVYAEPFLVLGVFLVFLKARLGRRLPAMRNYLGFRVGEAFVLNSMLEMQHVVPISSTTQCYLYFYAYWSLYLTGAVLIFFVIREVYGILMEPVPQLRRLGMMAFRWVLAISAIIAAIIAISASVAPTHTFAQRLVYVAQLCYHSVSVLELCLLAFIALTIHSLGRSFRSAIFGIALGFGVQAAGNFVIFSVVNWQHSQIWSSADSLSEMLTFVVLFMWGAYFLLPQRAAEREVQYVPSPSPLIRWNDVAQALGHGTPRVAAGASTGFFLQDVERVVDRVLARNQASLPKSESKVS